MIRGTTPSLKISLDYKRTDLAVVWITISQDGRPIINKDLDDEGVEIVDVTTEAGTHAEITLTLTQADTLALTSGQAELQVRALMVDDTAAASNIVRLSVKRILRDGEITLEA